MGEEAVVSKNFIEQEIEKDLREGVYQEVCTRFPPEPNGYLHIGHAKSILLNYGLAQKYNGTFHLRFDDTNPMKEVTEFVESIKKDVEWLGADFKEHLYFASDYFDTMYECAVKLIKKGKAYVCDLRKTFSCSKRCVKENIKTEKRFCVQRLIWHLRILICVIRLFIV